MESTEVSSGCSVKGSVNTAPSLETTSNPRKSQETMSVFGESSCGEPLVAQHLRINFTPTDADSEIVQKKCVDFWNFVHNTPEIRRLLVLPESNKYSEDSGGYTEDMSCMTASEENTATSGDSSPTVGGTAVSMLEFVEGKGLIDRIFEAKLPQSRCSIGYKDYCDDGVTLPPLKPTAKNHNSVSTITMKVSDHNSTVASAYTQKICKTMADWDAEHTKSMDPPSHPPALHRCTMQRTPH